MSVYEVRERVIAALDLAATSPCVCGTGRACIGCHARKVIAEVHGAGLRVHRWRNPALPAPRPVVGHIAGPIYVSREHRRSSPGHIVDQRQACSECGATLGRGRWSTAWMPGETVFISPSWMPGTPPPANPFEMHGYPLTMAELDARGYRWVMCTEPGADLSRSIWPPQQRGRERP